MKVIIELSVANYNIIMEDAKNSSRKLNYYERRISEGKVIPDDYVVLTKKEYDDKAQSYKLIPVNERLPEPDIGTMNEVSKSVLVCLKDKEDGTIFFCTGYYGYFPDRGTPEDRGWWCYYDSDKGKKIESEVLYWMPLPTPYKEEKQNGYSYDV